MKRKNDIIRLFGRAYESHTRAIKKNDYLGEITSKVYIAAYSTVLEMKYDDIKKAYEKLEFK